MEIIVISKPQADCDDDVYQAALQGVVAGILRWVDRPENYDWKEVFTRNYSWQFYQQGLDDTLYDAMGADTWLQRWWTSPLPEFTLWQDAIYQVTTVLCLSDDTLSK